eukprot:TRINITY_DN61587_c0_g1_i1.p1 TRINITY_DN61587_c0_g1~~TRINITY_DN61587_c0_g1_i1.p1  ORF type:complete len:322 (+),score=2.87 TRINITY_DN61587_c0_g1_i1:10-975(+)
MAEVQPARPPRPPLPNCGSAPTRWYIPYIPPAKKQRRPLPCTLKCYCCDADAATNYVPYQPKLLPASKAAQVEQWLEDVPDTVSSITTNTHATIVNAYQPPQTYHTSSSSSSSLQHPTKPVTDAPILATPCSDPPLEPIMMKSGAIGSVSASSSSSTSSGSGPFFHKVLQGEQVTHRKSKPITIPTEQKVIKVPVTDIGFSQAHMGKEWKNKKEGSVEDTKDELCQGRLDVQRFPIIDVWLPPKDADQFRYKYVSRANRRLYCLKQYEALVEAGLQVKVKLTAYTLADQNRWDNPTGEQPKWQDRPTCHIVRQWEAPEPGR